MRLPVLWGLVVGLVVSGSLAAAPSAVGYDLEMSRLLLRQSELLARAGQTLEEWSRGRLAGDRAAAAVRGFLARASEVERKVRAVPAPRGAAELGALAGQVARARVDLIRRVARFLSRGDAGQSALKSFLLESMTTNTEAQSRWLEARLKLVPQALGETPPTAVRSYYEWQAAMLPLQLEQIRLAAQVQRLLLEDASAPAVRRGAAQATRAGIAVRQRAEAVHPAPRMQEPHRKALEEQMALARLCEAVQLYSEDRSPEAVSRIRRALRTVSQRSIEAEQSSVEALASALGK